MSTDAPDASGEKKTPEAEPQPLDRHRLVYRWDLDKTYLRTEFDTVRDVLRTAFEKPHDKRTVPGAAALLRISLTVYAHD